MYIYTYAYLYIPSYRYVHIYISIYTLIGCNMTNFRRGMQRLQGATLGCPGSNISHIKCDIPVVCHGEGCHRERVSTW